MQQFEKNTALGADLEGRVGTDEEYSQVQTLADSGLAAARNLVAANPQSAEAQYMLGSWLIYGYRVVTTQETTTDAAGEAHASKFRKVVQGLSDDSTEGLNALKKAMELAPGNAAYALDYTAALLDMGQPEQMIVVLEGAWNGDPPLDQQQQARAGLLLADAYFAQGRISDAREWLYSTLLLNPENADIVRRLRTLDVQEAAPVELLPAPSPPAEAPEAPSSEEAAPAETAPAPAAPSSGEAAPAVPAAPTETAPAPTAPSSGEAAPEAGGDQTAPGTPSESPEQSAPPDGSGQSTTTPQQDAGAAS
jgi:tetratricopeptide (TPR) repeat protein